LTLTIFAILYGFALALLGRDLVVQLAAPLVMQPIVSCNTVHTEKKSVLGAYSYNVIRV
jgi:hypothetical protein